MDLYKALLYRVDTSFVRYLHDQINWKSRLIAILGARGVGKTTLLLQHIKLFDDPSKSLYVLADDFYFSEHRLFDLARDFYQQGGKKLYIDEIVPPARTLSTQQFAHLHYLPLVCLCAESTLYY